MDFHRYVRERLPSLGIAREPEIVHEQGLARLAARPLDNGDGAVMALTLAGLGIYGVLSYPIRARTRELGVRVALGAPPAAVMALVLRQAVAWTVLGAAAGIALALALTRFLGAFLHGLSATDAWTFTGVTLMLVVVAAIAAFVPARRASRLDPLVALRML